jgi:autotransporter translocation and assembly factor TamB
MSAALAEYRIDNEGAVDIRIEGDAIAFRRLIMTGPATRLSVSGGLRPGRDLDVTLNGNVNLSLSRLLYREVEHGDGSASVHLAVRDEWASPEVDGRVEVRDGVIKIRDIPQKFTAMNGAIVFDRNRVATEGLAADVGGGHVTVAGSAQMQGSSLLDFTTRASVENVTVRYPPGLTATLGGTLYYDGNAGAQTLSGEMNIRRATYEKRIEWKSMLVDITRGITRKKKTDIGWIGETQLNVRFTGDEDILFESNLARIPLKIDVLFRGTVDQMHLLGRVEAREGEVYFRKNVFRILYASADFVDPSRINPVLDVQGETRVREYRIRLAVSGNADRAVVTFLSEPPLADSDILALLALGRTGEELKGKEANIGIGESFSFATGKFQDILERRARSLTGLDRFQVDPYINKSDTAVPRVTVGKEMVQDRLYMTYSSNIGGTTPEQNVRVEYLLNRNISLLGEYDELGQIGADIKFRFEFR